MAKFECKYLGKEIIRKTVRRSGSTGRVYVPKRWIGKRVLIILTDD